jgi:hypothetical protein
MWAGQHPWPPFPHFPFPVALMSLVKDVSRDPNGIYQLSKADAPSVWCGEFVDHLGDSSRGAFESAMQHLQKQLR